jgi:glycosyltransferase involved in cell wall biosynthesis
METPLTSHASNSAPLSGKKVLFGITKSNWGGAQLYVARIAKGAQDAGAQVAVMAGAAAGRAGDSSGRLFEVLAEEHVQTIQLSTIGRDINPASEWRAFNELVRIIREQRPDALHLNSSKMGFLGALAGRVAGVKHIICTIHGWPHKEQRPLLWKVMAWLGSWGTLFLCHTVIVVSERDLRDAPTLFFRDSLKLVHNGISDFPRKSREEARAALIERAPELATYPHWLLMNAELHPNKGISTAIRALYELSAHYKDIALVVCGEGQDRPNLVELARSLKVASRVFLLDFVPNARENLAAADIYLMPSRKEGLPMALLEAGLASLPVVASKIGGIPEVITDHRNGLFMPRSNTHLLAKAITFFLDHPIEAQEMGLHLREKVLTDFSEREMIEKTIVLY